MRGKIFFLVCVFLCAALAGSAWITQVRRKMAYTVYLETVPADPRALLMGDYMALRFAFENKAERKDVKLCAVQKTVETGEKDGIKQVISAGVLELNAEGDECVTVRYEHGRYRVPHQFFFREGTGKKYEKARYAVVRRIGKDTLSIVALADENFNWIK